MFSLDPALHASERVDQVRQFAKSRGLDLYPNRDWMELVIHASTATACVNLVQLSNSNLLYFYADQYTFAAGVASSVESAVLALWPRGRALLRSEGTPDVKALVESLLSAKS